MLAAITGLIKSFFNSEEFYVLHYADTLPHFQAIQQFFIENGRLIEGIYWTYLYELFDYNPLLEHSLSFVLVLVLAILASACFLNVWPRNYLSWALPYLLVFLFFLNWISAKAVFRLSYDNTHLSMIFFFLSGLAMQRWAIAQRIRWLVLSLLFFLVSVLTYENAIFLYPALLLLTWPLLSSSKGELVFNRAFLFGGLTAISGALLIIPRLLLSFTRRNLGVTTELYNSLKNVFETGSTVYLKFGQVFASQVLNILVAVGILTILVTSVIWMFRIHASSYEIPNETKSRWTCIFLASIWLMLFGPLPYVLLGYQGGARVFSSAVFGVFPLLLMLYEISFKSWIRIVPVSLILLFGGLGLEVTWSESTHFNDEATLNMFFRELKNEIPHVKQNTTFIFIDGPPLDIPGCGPSLEMLYSQHELRCGRLRSDHQNTICPSVRHSTGIEVDCQHLSGGNWILITMLGGKPSIIDELKPGDYNLFLTWESTELLRTDHKKIVTQGIPPLSPMYLHLQWRASILFGIE
jgi:hypothetical protein